MELPMLDQILQYLGIGGGGAGGGALYMNFKTNEKLAAFKLHVAEKYVSKDALKDALKPIQDDLTEIRDSLKEQNKDIKELLKK